MNKRIILIILLIAAASTIGHAQDRFWHINVHLYYEDVSDTSLSYLKDKVLRGRPAETSTAAILLADKYGQQIKDFLYEELANRYKYRDRQGKEQIDWGDYYLFNQVRALYEDKRAIAGMDSIAQYSSDETYQRLAVHSLAEIGRYGYMNVVREMFQEDREQMTLQGALALYSDSPAYREESFEMMSEIIRTSSDPFIVEWNAFMIFAYDSSRAINLVDKRFREATGKLRWNFYETLEGMDRHGASKRAMWAIPREPDPELRAFYMPNFEWDIASVIRTGIEAHSKQFASPSFIRFVQNWIEQEPDQQTREVHFEGYLEEFKPLPPGPDITELQILDSLVTIKDLIATDDYQWLSDKGFVKELNNRLANARRHLLRGDSANAAKQIDNFRLRVEQVYLQSKNLGNRPGYPRYLSEEGYKFLYYNASYLKERLEKNDEN